MASAIAERDGPLSRLRYYDGTSTFLRQLPPQMLLVEHLLQTNLFPLQHYVQHRGAILKALYRISEGFWFSPSELVMAALLHFEDKVHRKAPVRAEGLPLLMPRLLSQVLEHLGFHEEPRIERRISCTLVLSMERSLTMPISFVLQQQDQEEVPDEVAEDPPRGEDPVPEVEVKVERSLVPDLSPPSPPPPPSSPAPANTVGPSYTVQQSQEHVHVSSRELAAVMDAVCALATTQASLDQRLARAEATIEQSHAMLLRIIIYLGLPLELTHRDQPTTVASLDMLAAAATASDPPAHPPPPRE